MNIYDCFAPMLEGVGRSAHQEQGETNQAPKLFCHWKSGIPMRDECKTSRSDYHFATAAYESISWCHKGFEVSAILWDSANWSPLQSAYCKIDIRKKERQGNQLSRQTTTYGTNTTNRSVLVDLCGGTQTLSRQHCAVDFKWHTTANWHTGPRN